MVDELLDTFQQQLFAEYDAILASDRTPRAKLDAVVRASFEAIDRHHSEVAIFQNDAAYLVGFERFGYLTERNDRFHDALDRPAPGGRRRRRAARRPRRRAGLPLPARHRLGRRPWYRPGGALSADEVADQYLSILFEGIADHA